MIIQQIDFECISVLETKDDAPVRPHRHRPEALQVPTQWVQSETMHVDVLDFLGYVQDCQDVLDLLNVLGIYPSAAAMFEELLQSLVAETYDHLSPIVK